MWWCLAKLRYEASANQETTQFSRLFSSVRYLRETFPPRVLKYSLLYHAWTAFVQLLGKWISKTAQWKDLKSCCIVFVYTMYFIITGRQMYEKHCINLCYHGDARQGLLSRKTLSPLQTATTPASLRSTSITPFSVRAPYEHNPSQSSLRSVFRNRWWHDTNVISC